MFCLFSSEVSGDTRALKSLNYEAEFAISDQLKTPIAMQSDSC
jgi:hypothetical protein